MSVEKSASFKCVDTVIYGDENNVSKHTVNTYLRRIYEKLHVHTRSQAVSKYHEHKRTE